MRGHGRGLARTQVWDVSRRDPRQHTAGRKLSDGTASRISSIQASSLGESQTLASTLLQHPEASDTPPALFLLSLQIPNLSFPSTDPLPHPPYSELWVYFVDVDVVKSHDFGELGRVPSVHSWEVRETKLLACLEVTTMFATPRGELKLHNAIHVDEGNLSSSTHTTRCGAVERVCPFTIQTLSNLSASKLAAAFSKEHVCISLCNAAAFSSVHVCMSHIFQLSDNVRISVQFRNF
ncbi:MAG: hypothetical protein SGPRY_001255 [Prymnesium sp.]